MPTPLIQRAMVIAHDPNSDGVFVILSTGQIPGFTVRRLYHGATDALRINKPPLPVRGTWGLVVFPAGDIRNGLWLGSYPPHMQDAIPNDPGDPFCDYDSHFSGEWGFTHGLSGYISRQFADGSYLVAGSSTSLATVYRHIVDDKQRQQRIPFTFSDRNPNPQPTFSYTFNQSGTGFNLTLDGNGNGRLTFAQGKTLTIQQSGTSASIVIDGNGVITFTTTLAHFTGDVHVDGEVVGKSTGVNIHLTTHTHPDPQGGNTGSPNAGT